MEQNIKSNIKPVERTTVQKAKGKRGYKKEIISVTIFIALVAVVLLIIFSHYIGTQAIDFPPLEGGQYITDIFYTPPVCNLPPILPAP